MSSQIGKSPSYLIRNPYSYCFRMFVPKDLQPYIGKKELRYSLKTGYLSVAKFKARILAGQVQLIFKSLRKGNSLLMKLSDNQIKELIDKYLKDLIKSYEEPLPPFGTSKEDMPPFIDQPTLDTYLNDLDYEKRRYNLNRNMGIYDDVEEKAEQLLKENGVDEIDKDSPSYWKLCEGLMDAEIKGIEYHKNRLLGKCPDNIDIDTLISLQPIPNNRDSQLLSKVIQKYVSEARVNWRPKTEDKHMATLNLFKEIVGDVPVQSITRKRVGEFKDVLKKLPPNMRKVKKYRDKKIPEILEMDVKHTLAILTINDHLQRVCSMFEYACINGLYDGPNPATKMKLPEDKSARERRAPFTLDELNKLFRSEQYLKDTFKHSYQFWTPIIALFHGMRQNEIAQLYLSDIWEPEEGIWVFDLNDDADDKSLKTKSSKRLVPIHPFVLDELNLLEYCKKLKSEGKHRLFPEINWQRDGYGQTVSEWFNENYKKKCGIADVDGRKKDYHSFRNTFINDLFQKQLPKDLRLLIVGHSIGRDETTKTYVEDLLPKKFYDEIISKVDFEKQIDLSHLKNSQYVIKD